MQGTTFTRRTTILTLAALGSGAALPLRAQSTPRKVEVMKADGCTCCEAWADTLTAAGFAVTVQTVDEDRLTAERIAAGVPEGLYGCHAAKLGNLRLEGHVPAEDIVRLQADGADAAGLSVTGMPAGSPGMEMGGAREAFDVVLWRRDGSTEVFRHYDAI